MAQNVKSTTEIGQRDKDRDLKGNMPAIKGSVIWFTGISGSGKTTMAGMTKELLLKHQSLPVQILDGDLVRTFFKNDLGYSRGERIENIKRIIFAASLLADNNVAVIVANIAPYIEVRDIARRTIKNYIQVYLKLSTQDARARDTKGLYQAFDQGKIRNIIGFDDPYEEPRSPDIVIDTGNRSLADTVSEVEKLLIEREIIDVSGSNSQMDRDREKSSGNKIG